MASRILLCSSVSNLRQTLKTPKFPNLPKSLIFITIVPKGDDTAMQGKFAHILQMNKSEITEAVNSLSEQEAKELLIIVLTARKN